MHARPPFPHWREWLLEAGYWCAFVALGVALTLPELERAGQRQALTEHSAPEVLQLLVLLATVGLLAFRAHARCLWAGTLSALAGAMALREADYWLDAWLFDGSWQLAVTALAVALLAWIALRRPRFVTPVHAVTGASGYFVCGCVVLAVSQGLGYTGVWIDLLGPDFERSAKNFVEESVELLGYGMLLGGALRYRLLGGAQRRRERSSIAAS